MSFNLQRQITIQKYTRIFMIASFYRKMTADERLREKAESRTRGPSGRLVSQISPALSAVLNSSTANHESSYTLQLCTASSSLYSIHIQSVSLSLSFSLSLSRSLAEGEPSSLLALIYILYALHYISYFILWLMYFLVTNPVVLQT